MGRAGHTDTFERIYKAFLDSYSPNDEQARNFSYAVIDILTDDDWDTVDELLDHDDPAVVTAAKLWMRDNGWDDYGLDLD